MVAEMMASYGDIIGISAQFQVMNHLGSKQVEPSNHGSIVTMGDPTLWITTTAMLGAAFGIEYLMVVKPVAHGADDGVLLLFLLLGAGAGWLRTREA